MSKTFNGSIKFPSNLDVQNTAPLDVRLVVDSVDDLINGSIEFPYQGMAVNVAGTSEIWILKTKGVDASHNIDNWGKVTGDNGVIDIETLNEIKNQIGDLENGLAVLTDIVGTPDDGLIKDIDDLINLVGADDSDEPTGIFKKISDLERKGLQVSFDYNVPVMTPELAQKATLDPTIDFDGSEDPYLLTDWDAGSLSGEVTDKVATTINGTYLQIMMSAIRSLQAEVARLKNSFEYGIDSYKNEKTAKSAELGNLADVTTSEPLWAIDSICLSEVSDNANFNTYLGKNHSFTKIGTGDIDVTVDTQLTFNDCIGRFSDGDAEGKNLTLYELKDSKLVTYLVSDKPTITVELASIDDMSRRRSINLQSLLGENSVNKYGFCIVISRKVEDEDTKTTKGFNYVYFSIIDYENDEKIREGYLTSDGTLSDSRVEVPERYSILSMDFDRLTLSRMNFYTKYEDFSESVVPSAPSEDDWKYEVAHITIRSVEDTSMLERVKDQLRDNELIWNKKSGTLHIKSEGKVHLIGSNNNNPGENNNEENMTNKEIIDALKKMGIVVNVSYEKDAEGNDTDKIASVENMSLAPISDFTFVNNETGKRFTYTCDTEGNLVGKDKSAPTIEEIMKELGTQATKFEVEGYQAVRGFSSDFFNRVNGTYDLNKGANKDGDAGKFADRVRFSSFYAPITTDEKHGCTHSFLELENTSSIDFPLTGVYLHFYNAFEDKVYHLELDGVLKAGSTYLIRGAQHAQFDDASAFIKVKTFDKEWYVDGKPLSFEQVPAKMKSTGTDVADDSPVKAAYRFCLTYGLPDLKKTDKLVSVLSAGSTTIENVEYKVGTYPNIILNPRFIDSCSFSTLKALADSNGEANPWYANGTGGVGITIKPNTMFRNMFALDPAKQAFNGFNTKDGSRVRYNKDQDIQILDLNSEFIGYPHSNEIIKIDRYTPKASFENKNVMTDKSQLNPEKPNMVTCSLGNDVYNTRCFNWISCGAFDEFVWVRKEGDSKWTSFESYKKVTADAAEKTGDVIYRKEYPTIVNNTVYARIINRFPGNDVLFTAHKCVIVLPDAEDAPVKYEYVVGRADKDGQPDLEHTNEVFTFTLYPREYEGRVYQITDQQGFHWIEYQLWAASAEFLNKKIDEEVAEINAGEGTKVFPILINTGDMTQSGARINEWLDYYNGGVSLFNHLEQINVVGNNDLNPIDPRALGTGNDNDKSVSQFFHYFYCFDVKDDAVLAAASDEDKKFFNGEALVVKAHNRVIVENNKETTTSIPDRYIPSLYYFKTNNVMYIMVNSEIPEAGVKNWFGLCSSNKNYVNIYTGIEMIMNGEYDVTTCDFTPVYETMYAWLNENAGADNRKVVVSMHEMPFTVITKASLDNSKVGQIPYTRNHPTGSTAARVGSNTNQLNINENRGTYWCSRLLEYFDCKLVLGGHKHTYALSYPIKEKYFWTYNDTTHDSGTKLASGKYDIKPMFATLEDEAGEAPEYNVSWDIPLALANPNGAANRTEYNIDIADNSEIALNSTKTPYIPEEMYNAYGKDVYGRTVGIFRCCTPLAIDMDGKYDGFITYSMCQATGYKLKSNKELPSQLQMFSKIIPKTTHNDDGDKPNKDQLYPMYSVLEFNDDCSEVDVKMIRISGIFETAGKDTFTQLNYGKGAMANQYLCTVEKEDCNQYPNETAANDALAGLAVGALIYIKSNGKFYVCAENETTKVRSLGTYKDRMYGKWLSESNAKQRLANHLADPTNVSDNRYLHIKF